MLRGLWHLAWLELKIFVREPLGFIATVVVPVVLFVALGRIFRDELQAGNTEVPRFLSSDLPVLVSMLIALNAVLSLVTIIAIYREGGILKRLRATPLRPQTILTAHVVVKLFFTALTFALMIAAGRRYYPVGPEVPLTAFLVALAYATACVLSLGFLIASLVPAARFAQPFASIIVYPMLAISGLFTPLESMPPALEAVARALPLTYAVSLLRGIWHGEGWMAHGADAGILALMFAGLVALSARVFRWE